VNAAWKRALARDLTDFCRCAVFRVVRFLVFPVVARPSASWWFLSFVLVVCASTEPVLLDIAAGDVVLMHPDVWQRTRGAAAGVATASTLSFRFRFARVEEPAARAARRAPPPPPPPPRDDDDGGDDYDAGYYEAGGPAAPDVPRGRAGRLRQLRAQRAERSALKRERSERSRRASDGSGAALFGDGGRAPPSPFAAGGARSDGGAGGVWATPEPPPPRAASGAAAWSPLSGAAAAGGRAAVGGVGGSESDDYASTEVSDDDGDGDGGGSRRGGRGGDGADDDPDGDSVDRGGHGIGFGYGGAWSAVSTADARGGGSGTGDAALFRSIARQIVSWSRGERARWTPLQAAWTASHVDVCRGAREDALALAKHEVGGGRGTRGRRARTRWGGDSNLHSLVL